MLLSVTEDSMESTQATHNQTCPGTFPVHNVIPETGMLQPGETLSNHDKTCGVVMMLDNSSHLSLCTHCGQD